MRLSTTAPPRDSETLLRRYTRTRDPSDLEQLVLRFRPLARRLARRYSHGGDLLDDLEQVACLGLVKALKRYEPDRGFMFASYAVPTILGELKRFFRDTAWSAHVPRSVQEQVAAVRQANDRWQAVHGRAPTARELARELDWPEETLVEALAAETVLSPTSMDGVVGADPEDAAPLRERLGSADDAYGLVEDRQAIEAALPALSPNQREALRLRFEEDLRQSDIAARLGVSQMQVSRLLRSGLERLSVLATHQSRAPAAR